LVGETALPGYYLATGYFRSGILIAWTTAQLLAGALVTGSIPEALRPFSPCRMNMKAQAV
jgi:glycine oxidase